MGTNDSKTEDTWVVKEVDQKTWSDFSTLFSSKGAPHYCWCLLWRPACKEMNKADQNYKGNCIRQFVDRSIPIGLLVYCNAQPVGWCSVAPRTTFRKLGGDESLQNVWSITCFYLARAHRGKNLTRLLISHAKKYAKSNGARYLEAFPVSRDSPSYRFMGLVPTFEKAGFTFLKYAGTRRQVMIYDLKDQE